MPSIYLTREGRSKLEDELRVLRQTERPKVKQRIAEARSKGDLSENAEYDVAKEDQARLESRIVRIQHQLAHAILIDDQQFPEGEAHIGRQVQLEDLSTGRRLTYQLVGEAESDFAKGKISTSSPVGGGLVGHSAGDEVEITVPAGIKRYRILKVTSVI